MGQGHWGCRGQLSYQWKDFGVVPKEQIIDKNHQSKGFRWEKTFLQERRGSLYLLHFLPRWTKTSWCQDCQSTNYFRIPCDLVVRGWQNKVWRADAEWFQSRHRYDRKSSSGNCIRSDSKVTESLVYSAWRLGQQNAIHRGRSCNPTVMFAHRV